MSNRYFKGEKVLLYTKFYDENGNIPDNIDNARVRILHENNGKIYQDMNWTELKNIGGNEFFSKYNIPFNSDNGIGFISSVFLPSSVLKRSSYDFRPMFIPLFAIIKHLLC